MDRGRNNPNISRCPDRTGSRKPNRRRSSEFAITVSSIRSSQTSPSVEFINNNPFNCNPFPTFTPKPFTNPDEYAEMAFKPSLLKYASPPQEI